MLAHPLTRFSELFPGIRSGAHRRQSSAAATTGRTQQNTSFVNSWRLSPPTEQNWLFCLVRAVRLAPPWRGPAGRGGFAPARPCRAGRACVRRGGPLPPRPSPPLPLGPLGGGCRCAPSPLPPSPCGGGGCGGFAAGGNTRCIQPPSEADNHTRTPPASHRRAFAVMGTPAPYRWSQKGKGRFRTQRQRSRLTVQKKSNGRKELPGGTFNPLIALTFPAPALHISPCKADNSSHISSLWPCRHDSKAAVPSRNCRQSAPTAQRRIFSSASVPPHSGAF